MQAEIELLRPRTLPEALTMLAEHAPNGKPLAGGTNMVVELRDGHHTGKILVDLTSVRELRGIREENGFIIVGGGTTVTELLTHPLIAAHAWPLKESAAIFANPLVRNRATLAGNLVDASPAADTAPPLLALDAEVELISERGTRYISLEDFMVGVRKTLIQPDELLHAVRWPIPFPRTAAGFTKVGLRKADAISVLSAAVLIEQDERGICTKARIALGAVAPRPYLAHEAEAALVGQPLYQETIERAANLAAASTKPIDDIRGKASYRRKVTEVTVRRLLLTAVESLKK